MAADRIKRLQGKDVAEKSLDYWSDKKKEEDEIEEKEALIKKYVTTPKTAPISQNKSSGMSRGKLSLLVFLVLAFFVGTGYGVYIMSLPANNSSGASMNVNDSAFPVVNNTTTNTTLTKNTTKTTTVTKKSTTKNSTTPTKNTNNNNSG